MAEEVKAVSTEAAAARKRPILSEVVVRLVKEKPLGTIGGVIVLILVFTAIFANMLAPFGENEFILADRLTGPSAKHWLGTDNLGRDLLSRIIYGSRISLYVGLGASILSVAVSSLIGLISGYFGGKTDMIIQRLVDAFMCFPAIFLYLSVMAVVGPGLIQVIMVLGISRGIRASRVTRAAVIGVKENVYVEAARAIGAPDTKILIRHIFPNVFAVIIILFTVSIGGMILAEATLSFLGFGIPPPTPSWGAMLSGSGRKYMLMAPWLCLWPGVALATVVYGLNMLGDGVRDILDPRLRGGLGRYSGVAKKRTEMVEKMGRA